MPFGGFAPSTGGGGGGGLTEIAVARSSTGDSFVAGETGGSTRTWDNDYYDPNGHLDLINDAYIVPSDGVYQVMFTDTVFNPSDNNEFIYAAATQDLFGERIFAEQVMNGTGTSGEQAITVSGMLNVAAGEEIQGFIDSNDATSDVGLTSTAIKNMYAIAKVA